MARLPRLHVSNGIYYVHLRVNSGQTLLRDPADAAELNQLVANALSLCAAKLHAFCWTASEAHLAVQVSDVPLGRLVQLITGPYARRLHQRLGQSGGLFQRHRAVLVVGDAYLLKLVRYIHWVPVKLGLTSDPRLHQWSSYHTYIGNARQSWVTTSLVKRAFVKRDSQYREAYSRWLRKRAAPEEATQFEKARGSLPAHIIVPSAREVAEDKESALLSAGAGTAAALEPAIDSVCRALDVTRAELMSPSRRHRASLARALVAWHGVRAGTGTLKDIAQCLGRHPSTLTMAIAHHRESAEALFAAALPELEMVAAGAR